MKGFTRGLIMNDIILLTQEILQFRDERDWEQFHNAKDLAIALSLEASELLELFLWKNATEANIDEVKKELADVLIYAFLLADKYQLDIKEIVNAKLQENAAKYPVDKAKGNSKKYTEL